MAREAYRSLYGDLTKLKDKSLLDDPAGGPTQDDELFQLLLAASVQMDYLRDRHFYSLVDTRVFDIEDKACLPVPDLIAVTTLKVDSTDDGTFDKTWATSDFLLAPYNAAPTTFRGEPYTEVLINKSTNGKEQAGFPLGQRKLEIVGRWGWSEYAEDSGTDINMGSHLLAAATALTVDDGTNFSIGQTIKIESEQCLITNIATHVLTIVRALNGTTDAQHDDDTDVFIIRWPAPIERATLITTARIWSRAPEFEPFFVDVDEDTDVRLMATPKFSRLVI